MSVRDKNATFSNEEDTLLQLKKRARRRLLGAIALVLLAIAVLWNVLDTEPPAQFLAEQEVNVVTSIVTSSTPAETKSTPPLSLKTESEASMAQVMIHEVLEPIASSLTNVRPASPSSIDKEALPGKILTQPNTLNTQDTREVTPESKEKTKKTVEKVEKKIEKKVEKTPIKKDPRRILEGLDDTDVVSIAKANDASSQKKVKYTIQVASYKDAAKAQSVVNHLKTIGVRVSIEKVATDQGQMIRIRVGPYADKKDAQAALKKMHAHGMGGTLVAK